jgi:hypothetical protein
MSVRFVLPHGISHLIDCRIPKKTQVEFMQINLYTKKSLLMQKRLFCQNLRYFCSRYSPSNVVKQVLIKIMHDTEATNNETIFTVSHLQLLFQKFSLDHL